MRKMAIKKATLGMFRGIALPKTSIWWAQDRLATGNAIANSVNCGAIVMLGSFPVVWLVSLVTRQTGASASGRQFQLLRVTT